MESDSGIDPMGIIDDGQEENFEAGWVYGKKTDSTGDFYHLGGSSGSYIFALQQIGDSLRLLGVNTNGDIALRYTLTKVD